MCVETDSKLEKILLLKSLTIYYIVRTQHDLLIIIMEDNKMIEMYEEMNEIFLFTTSPLIDYLILGAVGLVILWWADASR